MPRIDRPDLDAPTEHWLVYADALQTEDDPLGELIVLNHAVEAGRGAAARDAHLERHAEAIFGSAAPHRGRLDIAWRHCVAEAVDLRIGPGDDPAGVLGDLLGAPLAQSMRQLRLVAQTPSEDDRVDLSGALSLLGKGLPPTCTALDLVDERAQRSRILVETFYDTRPNLVVFGSLDAVWAVRHLASLVLHVADTAQIELGTIDAPALREFSLLGLRWYGDDLVPRLAGAIWPELRRLALRLPETITYSWPEQDGAYLREPHYDEEPHYEHYRGETGYAHGVDWPAELGPLLDALRGSQLEALSLTSFMSTRSLLGALATHGLPPTLRHLDLSGSDLRDEDLAWMVEHRAQLAQLDTLDLRDTLIRGVGRLAGLGPQVLHRQGDGALYRFSVGSE